MSNPEYIDPDPGPPLASNSKRITLEEAKEIYPEVPVNDTDKTLAALVLLARFQAGAPFTRDELKIVEVAKQWLASEQRIALDTLDPEFELHERLF